MSTGPPDRPDARVIAARYRLVSKIGQGGMGTVWRAYDEFLGRTVAVKEIDLPRLAEFDQGELRERALREARAAARLSHPNVVTVHDVVVEDGNPWIVMALVEAESLADVLRTRGPLAPARVAEIGLAVLGALETAHAAGIVHRDVKPANVLLARDGRIVLTDFGIATLEGDPSLTSAGLLLGAPAYIAPERAGGLPTGPASDLWSLGATLYAAVEGRPPYDRDSPMATLSALMTENPPTPRIAGPLSGVLLGLLQRDPARRPDVATTRRLLTGTLNSPHDQQTRVQRAPAAPLPGPPRVSEWTQVVARPDPEAAAAPVSRPSGPPLGPAAPAALAAPAAPAALAAPAGPPPGSPPLAPTAVTSFMPPGPAAGRPAGISPAAAPPGRWWASRAALTGSAVVAVQAAVLGAPVLADQAAGNDFAGRVVAMVGFPAWSLRRPAADLRPVLVVVLAGLLLFAFARSARTRPGAFALLISVWGLVAVTAAMSGVLSAPVDHTLIDRDLLSVAVQDANLGASYGLLTGWLPGLLVAVVARRRRRPAVSSTPPARAPYSPSSTH